MSYLFIYSLVIDANRSDMNLEELSILLNVAVDLKENDILMNFCFILKQFIEEKDRIPLLPNDLEYFLKQSKLHANDLIYLLENCSKIVILESLICDNAFDFTSTRDDQNSLNEFKFAAILAAEIQKIITRKYLPSVNTIKI